MSLVLVVGVGRSGTSLFTGIMGQLGFHVPQPEVEADSTNPRGFSEPRWVVDFHTRLLRQRRVTVNDARPAAFESTATADADAELKQWLDGQFAEADALVVKDPRTGWFLPLWTRVAPQCRYVTMLRHPAEILASATKSYGTWQSPASRAAAWINITLETERATRDSRRAFVRYEDLLDDWAKEIERVDGLLELGIGTDLHERFPSVDEFVDPTLHRNRVSWDEFEMPAEVRDMAESVWLELQPLADPGGDTPELHAKLDEARNAYRELYTGAEQIAQSSITAAKPRKKPPGKKPPPTLGVRAKRRVKRTLGSLRRS